ncbi:MAG: HEAT repeat domain-containing protein [Gemmatimonadota bacterium]|nr:HEAT repeat domain-containing protein [Gemmatimonadota bacterium]
MFPYEVALPNPNPDARPMLAGINRATLRLLSLSGRIRPDERRDVLGAFLTLFAFMAGHALLETARDALFLASLPARRLPWVYLAIAVVAIAVGRGEPPFVRRFSARNELGGWLLAASVVTAGFWFVAGRDGVWVLYSLYVWSGVIVSLIVVRFWTILATRFTVTQAKRVFPLIASGSVVGAIVGSGAARIVTAFLEPRHLVLAAAAAFFVASTAPALLDVGDGGGQRSRRWSGLGEVSRTIWTRPYLLRMAGLVLLATVSFTLIDFVFKSVADELVPADELGAFFASTYLAINVLSLVVQLLLVSWLLGHFGLVSAVVFVPAVLMVSTLGFVVAGGLTAAVVLKGADGGLRHSLYRTGTELLFVPLSERLRTQVKGVIDVVGQRGGQAVASILILMLLSTPAGVGTFGAIACLTTVGWLLVASGLKEHYLDVFRETLHPETDRRGSAFPSLDVASLDTLVATLTAPEDRRVIAALDILDAQRRSDVVPPTLLYHPSADVVVRAFEVFISGKREDALEITPRLLSHADARVRAGAVRALSVMAPDRAPLEEAFRDPDARVVGTARAAFVACGWDADGSVAKELTRLAADSDASVRHAVASALRVRPASELEPLLRGFLADSDTEVVREAVAAAGALGTPGMVEPLIRCLARRSLRDDVRFTLTRFGSLALNRLAEALADTRLPHSIRTQIPGAIALSGSATAPQILLRHLRDEQDGLIRFRVLRALGRWRREQPNFPLDGTLLQGALVQAVSTAFDLMQWRHTLTAGAATSPRRDTELHRVLVTLLRDKQDHALERAFRLLNLQSGSDEYQRVYRGLHSPIPQSRAGSRELLTHMVMPPLREPLTTLLDDLHGERDPTVMSGGERDPGVEYLRAVAEIVSCGIESASSVAAAHATELQLTEVAAVIEGVPPVSAEHAATLARAARLLSGLEVA